MGCDRVGSYPRQERDSGTSGSGTPAQGIPFHARSTHDRRAHNGYFATLEEIVHFYNTRDILSWPPPEVPENVNTEELGNLGLTAQEEADLVAFLRTLTDGYRIAPPRGRHRMTAVFGLKE